MASQLTDIASVERIIGEMTIEEKIACFTSDSSFSTRPMEKYGIPRLVMLDGGTGFNTSQLIWEKVFRDYVRREADKGVLFDEESCTGRLGGMEVVLNDPELLKDRRDRLAKAVEDKKPLGCYPPGILFGATWNSQVIEPCGHALGKEANALGVDVLLGSPNVNIHRDPLNGRLFEGYSEDPCLVSKLAPFFVKGIQAEGVIADAKHFAANNQETDRMGINEMISERALREIYLPGFRACVEAGCKTVMSAYNKINGVACAQNKWLLQDVLRGEWGFDGFVVTDWSAAYDQVEACAAGSDVIMPGPRQMRSVIQAVRSGILPERALDACVRHFLKIALETPAMVGRRPTYDPEEGIRAAYNAAKEGIVLLKNSGALPLKPDAHLAFYGKASKQMMDSGAGSAAVLTSLTTSVYTCAQQALGEDKVAYEEIRENTTIVIVTVRARGQEGADRPNMLMEPDDKMALDAAISAAKERNLPVVVLLNVAAPIQMVDWEPDADAILCLFIPGMQGGQAAMDILLGKVNPSGKLPITFPRYYRDCPSYGNFPGYNGEVWYGEGIYVGYRYYDHKGVPVMYPFGYGLSYTTFEITHVEAAPCVDVDQKELLVLVGIKNTGERTGAEVIQLYIHDVASTLEKPPKELKAFRKVFLEPGEEKEVALRLTKQDFASFDSRLKQWVTEPGLFQLLIGTSAAQIHKELEVEIKCENPYGIGPKTDIVKVVSNPAAAAIVKDVAGVSLMETAGSYIVFQPLTPFSQVWEECIVPHLAMDLATSQRMQSEIYSAWKEL